MKISKIFSGLNTGVVTNYALFVLIGLMAYTAVYYSLLNSLDISCLILICFITAIVFSNFNSEIIEEYSVTTMKAEFLPFQIMTSSLRYLFFKLIPVIIILIISLLNGNTDINFDTESDDEGSKNKEIVNKDSQNMKETESSKEVSNKVFFDNEKNYEAENKSQHKLEFDKKMSKFLLGSSQR